MSTFTVKTKFDLSENLIFSVHNSDGEHVGVAKTKDGKITFIDNENAKTHFEDDARKFEKFIEENNYCLNRPSTEDSKWVKYQPNPKNYKTGDCSIRAYTKVENMSWADAYDLAAEVGMEVAALPDDNKVVDAMLVERFKYTLTKLSKEERVTVKEFAIANPFGTYVLKMHGHVVALVDGLYYDSWDCGDKKISAYYTK